MSRRNEGLHKMLSVRVTEADLEKVHEVTEHLGQGQQATARAALRLGLAELLRDRATFMSETAIGREPPTRPKSRTITTTKRDKR